MIRAWAANGRRQFGFVLPEWSTAGLIVILIAALAFGLYGRFVGLGRWPFGVDEFYISRSVDNVLRTGVPRFLCGGFYIRGLTYQYLDALVRLSGLSPEFSGRLVSAVCSLLGLPAAYLIGRRLGHRALGIVMLIILLASVWEIEMARFARMYAPFQSIFLWYVVYFLRYTVDRHRAALVALVALSILGSLTWEGGALLGVANLLPPFLEHDDARVRRSDFAYLGGMLLLLLALLAATTDLRGAAPPLSSFPLAAPSAATEPTGLALYAHRSGWALLFLVGPLLLSARALPWIWSLRQRWLAAAGACVVLGSALLHQFALCGACAILLFLLRMLRPADARQSGARRYALALLACAIFWVAFDVVTGVWRQATLSAEPSSHRWLELFGHLSGYPNVFGEILRPWIRTMPWLTVAELLLAGVLTARVILSADDLKAARTLLILVIVLALAVGARTPGRVETRYTFFLYPLVTALSLTAIFDAFETRWGASQATMGLSAALCLLLFAATEDFRPIHVAQIDSARINFRIGMSPIDAAHYYPRANYRAAAAWLTQHRHLGDTVMIGIPSIAEYYQADFVFLQDNDERYEDFACRSPSGAIVDRWTNLPLRYGDETLAARIASGQRIFLIMYPEDAATMVAEAMRRHWRERLQLISSDGEIAALVINP